MQCYLGSLQRARVRDGARRRVSEPLPRSVPFHSRHVRVEVNFDLNLEQEVITFWREGRRTNSCRFCSFERKTKGRLDQRETQGEVDTFFGRTNWRSHFLSSPAKLRASRPRLYPLDPEVPAHPRVAADEGRGYGSRPRRSGQVRVEITALRCNFGCIFGCIFGHAPSGQRVFGFSVSAEDNSFRLLSDLQLNISKMQQQKIIMDHEETNIDFS